MNRVRHVTAYSESFVQIITCSYKRIIIEHFLLQKLCFLPQIENWKIDGLQSFQIDNFQKHDKTK